MLSSAGVTRPAWDDAKKERLVGAADIPIIRLNPGGILDKKAEAEQVLRASGVPYCVVRPTGLKFEGWPQGRPLLSQGDVAVGRTNVLDLAGVGRMDFSAAAALRRIVEEIGDYENDVAVEIVNVRQGAARGAAAHLVD